jgi:enoyl-CoA hydratase
MTTDIASPTEDVRLERRGGLGLITLNRPKALNALTQPMCLAIDAALAAWAHDRTVAAVAIRGAGDRAFCAGGDVRAVWEDGKAMNRGESDGDLVRDFFRDEYRMNRRIKLFPKPYVALMDGVTMGGGVGLSIHGSHRVATEKTLFAMPETAIGLFPDVGASFALPRLPGEIGTYLALTGARLKAADLTAVGIATHTISANARDLLIEALGAADWRGDPARTVETILSRHAMDPGQPTLPAHRSVIDSAFASDRVEDILAALDAQGGDFAGEAAATIRRMSPTSLKIALAEMRRGRKLGFDDCLRMEYRLTQTVLADHDFYEGIRAVLIDRDNAPKWHPKTLDAIDETSVDRYFEPPSEGDLTFPE